MRTNYCAAYKCQNNRENSPHLSFHRIPKSRWEAWVARLNNPKLHNLPADIFNNNNGNYHVCSAHFDQADYNRQGRKVRLRHDAIPHKNIKAAGPPELPRVEPSCEDVQRVDSPAAVDLPPPDAEESEISRSPLPGQEKSISFLPDHDYCAVRDSSTDSAVMTATACHGSSVSADHSYCSITLTPAHPAEGIVSSSLSPGPGMVAPYSPVSTSATAGSSPPSPRPCSPPPGAPGHADAQLQPAQPQRRAFRRGLNRRSLPHIIRVPKKERTPLVQHLIDAARRSKVEANTMRTKYLRKCQEVKRLKVSQEEDALALLQSKVNPRFFKLLRAEVRNYSRKPQARRWTNEEIAEMESMRQRGPRAFRGFPLTKPTRKTLKAPWKNTQLGPGINPHIKEMLRRKVAAMDARDRICYIMFDEMALRVYLSLLQKWDLVSGYVDFGDGDRRPQLAEEVMVAMVRSLYGTWKMPFAFWYTNKQATAPDFASIFAQGIETLLDVGFDVRAMVTDALQKNISAQHLLGSSYEKPFFFLRDKKIVTIADVPHLLKSLRNALLKSLLLRPDGTLIDIKFIKAFVLQDMEMPVRLAPKTTKKHIAPNNFEKMRVGLASELLSGSVGGGVCSYALLGLLPPEAHATGEFCQLINDFFDSFNGTRNVENPEPDDYKCALNDRSPHLKLWGEMLEDMQHWDFLGSDRVAVIRNWRMTIEAFRILWQDLRQEGHVYLPVGHVNQDAEENLFCGFRFNGGCRTNPSADEFPSSFLRSFVKYTTTETKGKNCRDDEAVNLVGLEELLEALKEADVQPAAIEEEEAGEEQGHGNLEEEQEEEFVVVEEENEGDSDFELEEDLQDILRPVPQHSHNILTGAASAKAAAPIIEELVAKLKCAECTSVLQTEPEYPLHIYHTMRAGPSSINKPQPSLLVSSVVQQIFNAGLRKLRSSLHEPMITKRLLHVTLRLPAVKQFQLCDQHNRPFRKRLLSEFSIKALQTYLSKRTKEYQERNKRLGTAGQDEEGSARPAPRKSTKFQRVAHL